MPLTGALGRWLGASWIPTVLLAFDAAVFAAAGWLIGWLHRANPMIGVLAFAVTLAFGDLTPVFAINVPWLVRLARDTFGDSLYLKSFAATAATHIFLFATLFAGGFASRPRPKAVSIVG